ncbi:hypothetical protein [Actinomadura sp. 9N407]|uniref:hypothetical protein n=1 Tax=Actinomadura sp. 9N407 TaxID=3375154 RepID=UPI0037ABC510
MAARYPEYYLYEETPVVFVEPPGGGLDCLVLSSSTGGFERDLEYVTKIRFGTTADIRTLSRTEFVQRVEEFRGRWLRGDGPVFALYETIGGIEQNARDEARRLTDEEAALVHTLRLRTHELFEAGLQAEGRPGTPGES